MAVDEFWCPNTLIDTWRRFLGRGIRKDSTLKHRHAFISNIGYSLQYLEFLDHQLSSVRLHSTIEKHMNKSFVVTGMSIVEAIMWYVLKKHGLQRVEKWEAVVDPSTNTFSLSDEQHRIRNVLERKLEEPKEVEASLMWMIRKVESKKLIGVDEQVYKDLNYLRGLRNKVHIHVVQHDTDTDWNAFSANELRVMKKALHGVLTSELFQPNQHYREKLRFLEVEEEPEDLLEEIPF